MRAKRPEPPPPPPPPPPNPPQQGTTRPQRTDKKTRQTQNIKEAPLWNAQYKITFTGGLKLVSQR